MIVGKVAKRIKCFFLKKNNQVTAEDLENIKKITNLIKTEVNVIFDIGANCGSEIELFYKIYGKKIKVYAFDCDRRAFSVLVKHNKKAKCFNLALSDKCGEIDFYPSVTNCGRPWSDSGSLRKPKKHLVDYPDVKFGNAEKVTSITIDQFCKDKLISNIDLIWMDVQGLETEVLLGAKNMLKNIKYIYTESYTEEIYEGQKERKDLLKVVSDHFDVYAEIDQYNILLKNKSILGVL